MRKTRTVRIFVMAVALSAFAATAPAAGFADRAGEKWVQRYNGPSRYNDYANAIAVDGAGNIYVTGESPGTGTQRDIATIKYNAAGKRIWVRIYRGPFKGDDAGQAIAVDAAGNVYVSGYSTGKNTGHDLTAIKYNKAGKQLWVSRYDGPVSGNDYGRAIAVDASGNVYVTGESLGDGTHRDIATVKFDKLGQQIWVKRYNGPGNGDDAPSGIAVDKAGNVFVTGFSLGKATGDDYVVIKY
ncbi:MAG: SBBP repeat-containing protein [Candidatus Aminicenantes bacterium]|nr:SBBP repeat-containing protein [Candidatus Aminicenantes bacterium]